MAERIETWGALQEHWNTLTCTEGRHFGRPAVFVSRPGADVISAYTPDVRGYSIMKMLAERQRDPATKAADEQ